MLLTLITAAQASGERNVQAIGQRVDENAEKLVTALDPPCARLPGTATLLRARRVGDVAALEDRLARVAAGARPVPPPPATWHRRLAGSAKPSTARRCGGVNRHGASVHLVGLVRHTDGVVLGQVVVADKSNEIIAAPRPLAGRDLIGTATTMDTLLALCPRYPITGLPLQPV